MPHDIEIVVRRRCRHGQSHPHSLSVVNANGEPIPSWCTEGDHHLFTRADLIRLFDDELAGTDPRMERVQAPVKARQLVGSIEDKLRQGVVTEKL